MCKLKEVWVVDEHSPCAAVVQVSFHNKTKCNKFSRNVGVVILNG